MKSLDPKKLLLSLQSGESVPFPDEDSAMARRLLQSETPDPGEIEALPAALGDALVEAAVIRKDAPLIERLSASTNKALAKTAKKAAYRLRSAGMEVAAPKVPTTPPPAILPRPSADELPALLSGPSGTGERALIVVRPIRGGGLELFQVVMSDELGVLRCERQPFSRADYRQQLKELRRGNLVSTMEIDNARAREEVSQALAANVFSRNPLPPGTDELVRFLGAVPLEILPELPPPEDGDATMATEGHTLHNEPEIRGWLPPESDLQTLTQRMEEVLRSPLQLSEAQKGQQLFEAFRKSAQEFFTPERKRLYARRLWRMAEVFERTNRDRQARLARAEARRLFHDSPGFFSRFAEFLFEKVLHLSRMMSQTASAAEAETAPAQVGSNPATAKDKRSPGGLILP